MKTIRIFISSPSDVEVERQIAIQVINRLSQKYQNSIQLKPILWEREPLLASGHFQDALDPSTADIMVCMLWSRLGSPLPEKFEGVDGRKGLTGSEWEFDYAVKAFEEKGRPEIIVYRKTADISTSLNDEALTERTLKQKRMVDAFFQTQFHNKDNDNTFKRAFFPFEQANDFEEQLETHLNQLIEKRLQDESVVNEHHITWHQGSPFLGLASFNTEHQGVFFGRTRAIGELMNQYKLQVGAGQGFVMVTGMSGSGKSSLVNAGILPLITTPRVVQYQVGNVTLIRTRPGDCEHQRGPLMGLCEQLVASLPEFSKIEVDAETLFEQINHSPKGLAATFKQIIKAIQSKHQLHQQVEARIQLVLDQTEELFTTSSFNKEHQQQFWLGIKQLIKTGVVWFIGSMRSDFEYQGEGTELVELMRGSGRYNLQPPTSSEIEQIITQPAKAAGLNYEVDENGISLATVLREATASQPGSLPLLEFCLDELFSLRSQEKGNGTLTFSAYFQSLGELTGAISKKAEAVIQNLKTEQQIPVDNILPKLFNALIQLDPDNPDDVATAKTIPIDYFQEDHNAVILVEALVEARLLIVDQTEVRIGHEALIHRWERIQQWLAIDKEFQTWKARIDRESNLWAQEFKLSARLLSKGKPLTDAESWLRQRAEDLDPQTIEFIQSSLNKAKRYRKNMIYLVTSIAFVLCCLTLFSFFNMQQAEKERNTSLITQSRFLADLSRQQNELGNHDRALLLSLNALPGKYGGDRPYDYFAENSMYIAAKNQKKRKIIPLRDDIYTTKMSHDGRVMVSLYLDGTAEFISVATGEAIQFFDHSLKTNYVEFSPDDKKLVIAAWDGLVTVLSVSTGQVLQTFQHQRSVLHAAFNQQSSKLVTASGNKAFVWSIETGEQLQAMNHAGEVSHASFHPKGNIIVTVHFNGMVKSMDKIYSNSQISKFDSVNQMENIITLWSTETGDKLRTLNGNHSSWVENITFSPDGKYLFTSSWVGKAALWSLVTGDKKMQFEYSNGQINSAEFSLDGQSILIASGDNTADIWSLETGDKYATFQHSAGVESAVYIDKGQKILTLAKDNNVAIWSVDNRQKLQSFSHNNRIKHAVLSVDKEYLITIGLDRTLVHWALDTASFTGEVEQTIKNKEVLFSTDGEKILFISTDEARLILAKNQLPLATFKHEEGVNSAKFSPDGKSLLTTSNDDTATLWSVTTGKKIKALKHQSNVHNAVFGHNGKKIVTISEDNIVSLWSTASGNLEWSVKEPAKIVSILFSPDAKSVLTALIDGSVSIWSVSSGKRLKTLNHNEQVNSAVFSPDGKFILTASNDNSAVMWSYSSGDRIHTFQHDGIVNRVIVSSDGAYVVTASNDNTAVLWSIESGRKLMTFEHDNDVVDIRFRSGSKTLLTMTAPSRQSIYSKQSSSSILLWAVSNGEILQKLQDDSDFVFFDINSVGDVLVAVTQGKQDKGSNGAHSYFYEYAAKTIVYHLLETNLTLNSVINQLPINRKCLTPKEREEFFLVALTAEQWAERGCPHFANSSIN